MLLWSLFVFGVFGVFGEGEVTVSISLRSAERDEGVESRQRRVVRIRVAVESEPATLFGLYIVSWFIYSFRFWFKVGSELENEEGGESERGMR